MKLIKVTLTTAEEIHAFLEDGDLKERKKYNKDS